ncbi:carbohydrate ABC transporter permease [Cohnella nanjingensis]|uniref:Carbohydrate ABC transporter permease n=1 Tax=Cohnella nanjingensis TaxID=1387779 RepID=A0A7X0RR07_9BACL|nr:carbohydrate ABC transporter permease [Cohnella nanjingensis]MBB6670669.1 carbohydrate ABC transporter permease [Cohnella nanjingensis]
MTRRISWGSGAVYALLLLGAAIAFLPFAWMLLTSFKTFEEVNQIPIRILPHSLHWDNYAQALNQMSFFKFMGNTVFITILSIVGTVLSCSVTAYAFAKYRFPGKNMIFGIVLATMMIPGQITSIPLYIQYQKFGWIDTYYPLIVPLFFATTSFGVFLLRQFFMTIPNELTEAARLDGCGEFRIFRSIVIPLVAPALTSLAVFVFLWTWNDLFNPVLYLQSIEKFTLSQGLTILTLSQSREAGPAGLIPWQLTSAAMIVVTLPSVLVFFFAQKQFVEGIAMTGIKS